MDGGRHEISLTPHPGVGDIIKANVKLVRYQQNPEPNWGPAKAAQKGTATKGKGKSGGAVAKVE